MRRQRIISIACLLLFSFLFCTGAKRLHDPGQRLEESIANAVEEGSGRQVEETETEYDDFGNLTAQRINGIWYIWDFDFGFQEAIKLKTAHTVDTSVVSSPNAKIRMSCVFQLPELPTGCEIVSTYMVLKYLQFPITKLNLADKYFINPEKDPDFRFHFVGDPYTIYGLGCYAPAVVKGANEYLKICESDYLAFNYTGYTFETLLNEVAKGHPVILWATQYLSLIHI